MFMGTNGGSKRVLTTFQYVSILSIHVWARGRDLRADVSRPVSGHRIQCREDEIAESGNRSGMCYLRLVSRWGTPRLSEDVECLSVNSWIFIPDSHGFETSIAISFQGVVPLRTPKVTLRLGGPKLMPEKMPMYQKKMSDSLSARMPESKGR